MIIKTSTGNIEAKGKSAYGKFCLSYMLCSSMSYDRSVSYEEVQLAWKHAKELYEEFGSISYHDLAKLVHKHFQPSSYDVSRFYDKPVTPNDDDIPF